MTHRIKRPILAILCAALMSIAVAACGGSGSGSGNPSSSNTASAVKFARCMREHGVQVETPTAGGPTRIGARGSANGSETSIHTLEAAGRACRKYSPGAAAEAKLTPAQRVAQEEAVQKFSKCMREHGIHVETKTSAAGGGIAIRVGGPADQGGSERGARTRNAPPSRRRREPASTCCPAPRGLSQRGLRPPAHRAPREPAKKASPGWRSPQAAESMDSHQLDDGSLATDPGRPAAAIEIEEGPQPGRSRRLLAFGALAALLIAGAAIVAVVTLGSSSPSRANGATGVPAGETTTSVTRRTLTESSTVDGTLGYKGSYELYDRLAEAGTFTWLPAVGDVIRRGGTLFRVNNLPVALMYGAMPAYRTLAKGVSDGPDVRQLNRNLKALGFDPYDEIGELDHFSTATARAVRRWQKALGLKQTGKVDLGRVVFAPAAQRVTKVDVALGQDPPGATGATGPTGATGAAGTRPTTPASETSAPTKSGKHGKGSKDHGERSEGHGKGSKEPSHEGKSSPGKGSKEPSHAGKSSPGGSAGAPSGSKAPGNGESSRSPSDAGKSPTKGSSSPSKGSNAGPEGAGGGGMLVLGTTSTEQIVKLQVKADQQQLARDGESAPVTLPSGRVVQGRITEVGTVASESSGDGNEGKPGAESSGNGENATIPVTLTLDHPVAHLDEAPVSVELLKNISRNVLAVPATALTATAGGGYAIEALERGRRVEVPVTPGMFANGYVQIEGPGVEEGLTVIESE